jgi:hypothetical protein
MPLRGRMSVPTAPALSSDRTSRLSGSSYCDGADDSCSATTLRRWGDEWVPAGVIGRYGNRHSNPTTSSSVCGWPTWLSTAELPRAPAVASAQESSVPTPGTKSRCSPHFRYHVRAGVQRDRNVEVLEEFLAIIGETLRENSCLAQVTAEQLLPCNLGLNC